MRKDTSQKEIVVSTAMQLMRRNGYADVSVQDICKAAEVPRSSFYNMFSGKDDILLYILQGHKDNYEVTMEQLLDAQSSLEKLWILLSKYLALPEEFGPDLTGVLMQMELQGKFSMQNAVYDYVGRYQKWFVRFAKECQEQGIIAHPGDTERIVQLGVELSYHTVNQWCACKGNFPLRTRVYEQMEDLFAIPFEWRGKWK